MSNEKENFLNNYTHRIHRIYINDTDVEVLLRGKVLINNVSETHHFLMLTVHQLLITKNTFVKIKKPHYSPKQRYVE
jgi:hypothetical protein